MRLPHLLLVLAVNLAFGMNIVASKYALGQAPPYAFAAARFLLVLLILFPFLKLVRGQMKLVLGTSLAMGVLHFGLIYQGLARADDASTVAIAVQLAVPFSTVLSIAFLGERVGWRRWLGMLLAFSGILVVGFDPRVLGYADALVLVIAGAFAAAVGIILMKKMDEVGVFELQAWIAALACPGLALFSVAAEHDQMVLLQGMNALAWTALVFSALGTSVFGHGGMYWLLQRYDVSLISPMMLLASVFGIVFGVLLLGDQLTSRMLLGGAITLGGVLVISLREPSRRPSMAVD